MTLRNISIDLALGQTVLVGAARKPARITKIEYHERSGEITINTTEGSRKALTFALDTADTGEPAFENLADKYR